MTQVIKKNKNKNNQEHQIQDPPQVKQEDTVQQGDSFKVQFDEETGTVELYLLDGSRLVMKEPKAKALLLAQSWMNSAPEEYKTEAFSSLRLAHICIKEYSHPNKGNVIPKFADFMDDLEIEDVERLGEALICFPKMRARFEEQSTSV